MKRKPNMPEAPSQRRLSGCPFRPPAPGREPLGGHPNSIRLKEHNTPRQLLPISHTPVWGEHPHSCAYHHIHRSASGEIRNLASPLSDLRTTQSHVAAHAAGKSRSSAPETKAAMDHPATRNYTMRNKISPLIGDQREPASCLPPGSDASPA